MGMIICFQSEGTLVDKAIEKVQLAMGFSAYASRFTHVAVSGGGPFFVESTFPFGRVSDLRVKGVDRIKLFLFYKNDIFRSTGRYKVSFWAATKNNLPYSWPSLLWFPLRLILPLGKKNFLTPKVAFFCSYLCCWSMNRSGFDPFPSLHPSAIVPAHFIESLAFDRWKVRYSTGGR